jgi:hypothetical protein
MFFSYSITPNKCHGEKQQTISKKLVGQKDGSPIKYERK